MQFYKTEKEFRQKENIEPECVVLTPWEDFGPAIERVLNHRQIVYDFNKLVESLAASYRKNATTPEDPDYDYETQAMEWIDYNTMRSLPYFPEKFRPIVVSISEEELTEFLEQLYSDYDKTKIEQLMQNETFVEQLTTIRQFSYDEFDGAARKLLEDWLND